MKIAEVKVSQTACEATSLVPIPKGIVGATVSIEYTDPTWDGLRKTVVFRSYTTKDVLDAGDEVTVPAEVVARAGVQLYMGVYGVDADGAVAIPTIWASLGMVRGAAAPSGDSSTDPSLPVWAQIQAMIGDLDKLDTAAKENLVAAVNEALVSGGGTVSPSAVQKIVDDYLKANPPAAGKDGKDGTNGKDGVTPNIQIGTVTTLPAGSDATASFGGTSENPLLNLGIPKGADGQGGGAGETWQFITEITLDDAVNVVTINKDANGNSFALKRVMIDCVITLDTDDPFTNIKTRLNGHVCSDNATPVMDNSKVRYYSFYAEIIPGSGALCWHVCSGANYNWGSDLLKMGYKYNNLWQSDAITSLSIHPNDGNKNIGLAGTKIHVLGVRA